MTIPTPTDVEQNQKLNQLSDEILEVKLEMAGRRPLEVMIKYGAAVIFAAGAGLSFLGYSSLKDIEERISGGVEIALRNHIASEVSVTADQLKEFYSFVALNEKNMESFNKLLSQYKTRIGEVDKILEVSLLEDIEGEMLRIQAEMEIRSHENPGLLTVGSDTFEGTLFERNWRLGVVSRLGEFAKSPEKIAEVSPDTWFNFIQLLRSVGMSRATVSLAGALPADTARPDIMALKYSVRITNETGEQREETFTELMNMVSEVDERSPHIVVAEAWNATETYRRYSEFINSLETAILNRESRDLPPISYLHITLAESYMRRGFAGDPQEAKRSLEKSKEIIMRESPYNQWYETAAEKISEIDNYITKLNL